MSLSKFIDELASQGIMLTAESEQLRIRARQGVLTPDLRDRISERKEELLELLQERDSVSIDTDLPQIIPNNEDRYQPFPLTDIQHAYWVGRDEVMELGNIGVHAYIEIQHDGLDVSRLNSTLQTLIKRHDMMRMVIHADGQQQVLETVPDYNIEVTDCTNGKDDAAEMQLNKTRQLMDNQILSVDQWPLFDIRATRYEDNKVRLHISLDILMADLWSLFRMFSEWKQLYDSPKSQLPDLDVTFRDYVLAEQSLEQTSAYQKSRSYWLNRINHLSPAPELPLAKQPASIAKPVFKRRSYELDKDSWDRVRKIAASLEVTPSGLLLTAFAEVLTAWSKNPKFTLNLTLFNRLPMHPQVNSLLGDFTTTILLGIDNSKSDCFEDRARCVQKQLYADLEHRIFNGVRVLREMSQKRVGLPSVAMPVVFSSALGLGSMGEESTVDTRLGGQLGEVVYTITQTPQVWIDHQVFENNGALNFNWDVVEELFPEGMLDDMFEAYCDLLQRLAEGGDVWALNKTVSLPQAQLDLRNSVNDTSSDKTTTLLHELVLNQASLRSEAEAVVDDRRRMTYGELFTESNQLARKLQSTGAKPNALVAIVLDKGWEQIVAALGTLNSGAAYLPIDPELPETRRNHILSHGEVSLVVTHSGLEQKLNLPEGIKSICVDDGSLADLSGEQLESVQQPQDIAYVIYTSGSTGMPKGVVIEHQAVVNTIVDINKRYNVNQEDRVLAVSALSFDLSVYDIFGILSAGGAVVLLDSNDSKDSARWWELIKQERVTLWNSVPALFQMLVDYVEGSGKSPDCDLREVLLSGDWIPLDLPSRANALWENTNIHSQGGATEASIWSICYPIENVDANWQSVPYGKPLNNQSFHVFDNKLNPCPDWVTGQLYIGGTGLARGYWRDEVKSQQSFIVHPETGESLYRTGDLGRYLPDGNIEFLGREDHQVKVNGYRIELGEIETTIKGYPNIKDVVVCAIGEKLGDKKLVAYIVPERSNDSSDASLESEQIKQHLKERLPSYMVPKLFVTLESLPLTENGKVDRRALPEPAQHHQSTSNDLPNTPLEKQVAKLFASALSLDEAGINDSFFELGGDSLLATRFVANVSKTFNIELHLRDLFQGPTVAELVAHISGLQSAAPNMASSPVEELGVHEEEGEL